MKLVSSLFKEDRLTKQLKPSGLMNNSLDRYFLSSSIKYYYQQAQSNRQQELIKYLLKNFQQKNNIYKKIKILILWTQIFKVTKYDLSDILLSKKLKIFTKTAPFKQPFKPPITQNNIQDYLLVNILVPLYNYFMKMHCVQGKVPQNDAFRRGTKIRYIWVLKIYNLISSLTEIVSACCTVLKKFPNYLGLFEITKQLYKDILIMNSFIIQAIEQGCQSNFFLMPYVDMLQFFQCVTEQKEVGQKINQIYLSLKGIIIFLDSMCSKKDQTNDTIMNTKTIQNHQNNIQCFDIQAPRLLHIDKQDLQEIQTQALKIRLISNTLKNPKKNHKFLETQYYQRLNTQQQKALKTQQAIGNQEFRFRNQIQADFIEKYRNLD